MKYEEKPNSGLGLSRAAFILRGCFVQFAEVKMGLAAKCEP